MLSIWKPRRPGNRDACYCLEVWYNAANYVNPRCDRCITSDVEGRLKSTILTTKREMVDVQTSVNIELFPAFILLWWWDWHNLLRYIKLQVNNKRLCSQGVLVFKWITLVTSVSQGDLWFSYNFHIVAVIGHSFISIVHIYR
jgi:hypothetical protein